MIEQVAESDMQNQYFIKFQILHPRIEEKEPQFFEQINLDRIQTKGFSFKKNKIEKFDILCSVNTIDDRKCLTISSQIVFKNITTFSLRISFIDKLYEEMLLNPGDSVPIPFDLINNQIQIHYQENASKPILLSKTLTQHDFHCEITVGDYYLLL